MVNIKNISDLVKLATTGDYTTPAGYSGRHFFFTDQTAYLQGTTTGASAPTANSWTSLRQLNSTTTGHGNVPNDNTTPVLCDSSTQGAWPLPAISGAGPFWLVSAGGCALFSGDFLIYDRIAEIGGFDATVTGGRQDVALDLNNLGFARTTTFDPNGIDVEIWVEIYGLIGTTAATLDVYFTDSTATQYKVSTTIGGTGRRIASTMIPVDTKRVTGSAGIVSIDQIELLATTGTAGNYGLTVLRPLARISTSANVMNVVSFIKGGDPLIEIPPTACIALAFRNATANVSTHQGFLHIVEAV